MEPTYHMTKNALIGLFLILLVATLTRLGDGGAATHFRYDEAQLSLMALDLAHGEDFPLVGIQSSAGVPNSPMSVYWLALPFVFTDSPFIVTLVIAFWNVLGVGLLALMAYRYFGPQVAFWAGMIYAVNPYAVYYSRSIWAQDYHTPIILFAFFLGLLGFLEGKRVARVLFLPILMIGVQIHFAAFTLLPICIWFVWVGRDKLYWKELVLSAGLAILTVLPFAVGIAQEPDAAQDRASLITSIVQSGLHLRWYPLEQVRDLVTGFGMEDILARDSAPLLLERTTRLDILWYGLGLCTLVGILMLIVPRWRKMAGFLWIWAGVTLVAFIPIWTGSGVFHHYFVPSLPAFALLGALGIVGMSHVMRDNMVFRAGKVLLYACIGVALLNQAVWSLAAYQFTLDEFTYSAAAQRTTTPFTYLLDVHEILQEYDDVIILGGNPHETNYYIWEPMLYESASCVRDLLINDGLIDILPAGEFVAVVPPLFPINENYVVPARYQHGNPIEVPLRPGEDPYIMYPFTSAPKWEETPLIAVDAPPFENGIRLRGYHLGESLLQLEWEVLQTPGSTYQYFVHFLNAEGERLGQRDAPFYVGQHWCEGDRLITTTLATLPDELHTLRIGMYQFRDDGRTINQSTLDEGNNPIGSWVDVVVSDEQKD